MTCLGVFKPIVIYSVIISRVYLRLESLEIRRRNIDLRLVIYGNGPHGLLFLSILECEFCRQTWSRRWQHLAVALTVSMRTLKNICALLLVFRVIFLVIDDHMAYTLILRLHTVFGISSRQYLE